MDYPINSTLHKTSPKYHHIIAGGFALFSMFFGAGNIVFPLALGQQSQSQTLFAVIGLLFTAVGVPLAGVFAMTLFSGDYKAFFSRIGRLPGILIAIFCMSLIGPLGIIPRCIALSFATIHMHFPSLTLTLFSLISCAIIFLFTFKKNRILELLGYILTPLLLLFLGIIVIKGLWMGTAIPPSSHSQLEVGFRGLKEGYQTMDLLGSFFFSGVVFSCLRKSSSIIPLQGNEDASCPQQKLFMKATLQASALCGILLALIYIGFCYVAAYHSEFLASYRPEELLGALAIHILGPQAAIVASLSVALACLTTAIATAAVFAEFLSVEVCRKKLSYLPALVMTLVGAFSISILNFTGIVKFLVPVLELCYPALITLCLMNIAYKLYHFQPVKRPVGAMFLVSLLQQL